MLSDVPVMILAAGLGTRLRPLTLELPKPAVPVANRPLIAYALDVVARNGGRRVVINAHHLADRLEEAARASAAPELEVHVVHEPTLLGTGGGIRNARSLLLERDADTVVVLNSDILFAPDLAGALALHCEHGAIATMVLRPDPEAERYGSIEIDDAGRVRRMLGEPEACDVPLRRFMFTGVHVLSRAAFDDLPPLGCIVRHAYRRWVDGGAIVAGHVDEGPWRDLGTITTYLDANLDLASGRLAWPGIEPSPDGNLVDLSARIGEGAKLRGAVVGARAEIAAGLTVERAVVWPGARVTSDVQGTVVPR